MNKKTNWSNVKKVWNGYGLLLLANQSCVKSSYPILKNRWKFNKKQTPYWRELRVWQQSWMSSKWIGYYLIIWFQLSYTGDWHHHWHKKTALWMKMREKFNGSADQSPALGSGTLNSSHLPFRQQRETSNIQTLLIQSENSQWLIYKSSCRCSKAELLVNPGL